LGDGRLVDADMHLEYPNVVSEHPSDDFEDWTESDLWPTHPTG